jgi:membrane associated rhomboid family serine protease
VECGCEAERDEMFGAADDLRCSRCADRYRQIFQGPRRPAPAVRQPVVTLTVCGLAFVASVAYFQREPFTELLLISPDMIWDGELWRLLTSVFPHANWLHLLFNVYWLWRFGSVVEAWLGPFLYAGLLLLLAAGSSAADFLATLASAVGLSGVGYGLFGLLFALRHDKDFAAAEMQPRIVQLFIAWFFVCILFTYTDTMPVANVAHGAGAVLGWLTGRAILAGRRVWFLAAISFVSVGLFLATLYMPWNGYYAWHRGYLALKHGDQTAALYWYEKAANAHPENRDLRQLVNALKAGQNVAPAQD